MPIISRARCESSTLIDENSLRASAIGCNACTKIRTETAATTPLNPAKYPRIPFTTTNSRRAIPIILKARPALKSLILANSLRASAIGFRASVNIRIDAAPTRLFNPENLSRTAVTTVNSVSAIAIADKLLGISSSKDIEPSSLSALATITIEIEIPSKVTGTDGEIFKSSISFNAPTIANKAADMATTP